MQDLLALLGKVSETNNNDERESIDRGHSPKPVRAMSGNVEIEPGGRIDFESIIGACNKELGCHFGYLSWFFWTILGRVLELVVV